MDVPTSEVGYTSATTGRGDRKVQKGHVVVLAKKKVLLRVVYEESLSSENVSGFADLLSLCKGSHNVRITS
jgi:hypothetical protein